MSYQGTKVKIPLGDIGLLTDIAQDKTPPNSLIKARNICFFNGTVQKAPGAVPWNRDTLGKPIVATHNWWPDVVTQRMIAVTSDGDIHIGRDRVFGTAVNTDLGLLNPNCLFTEGGLETAGRPKKLFLFTAGKTLPQVLTGNGSTFTPIALPNTDWTGNRFPKCGVIHRARLWAFSGHIAYASATGDHEDFQANTSRIDPIYPGEGDEIRGAFVFKGRLIVFKDGGFVYMLNDDDSDQANWVFVKIASNFGLAAPNGIDEVLNNLYAGNNTGTVTDYAASEKLGSVEAADLVQDLQFESYLRGTTSKVGVSEQHMLYYPEKKLLFVTYRSAYYTTNDMLLVFDFGRTPVRPSYWIKGRPQCLALYKDVNQIQRPMYGSADGFLMLMDQEDRSERGIAYSAEFQIPHLDFSHAAQELSSAEKQFDHLAVHYVPEGIGTLMCDYYIDGRFIETISFPMTQYLSPRLDTLELDRDRLAQRNNETVVRPLRGTGRTFSAKFYNSNANESFQVSAITVMFRGGGEKAQQTKSGGR